MSTYTEREVAKLHEIYTQNPILETVDRLSVLLNKPRKSIISKLVKEGIYESRGYRSKTGEKPITKLAIVRSLESALALNLQGLDKAPKGTLQKLEKTVLEMKNEMSDIYFELKDRE